jgi:hypothetical protein
MLGKSLKRRPMNWNNSILHQWEEEHKKNLEKAAITLVNAIKTDLNIDQPYTVYHGKKGIWYKGLDPSEPDNPPH